MKGKVSSTYVIQADLISGKSVEQVPEAQLRLSENPERLQTASGLVSEPPIRG